VGIEPHLPKQTTASPKKRLCIIITAPSRERERERERVLTSCGPQSSPTQEIKNNNRKRIIRLYSTCASPVVPHPSTGHAHGCLASEIGRDPAFPTRFDRTVSSPEVSLLTPSRHTIGPWKGTGYKRITRNRERLELKILKRLEKKKRERVGEAMGV
jgi:hypothetical protein